MAPIHQPPLQGWRYLLPHICPEMCLILEKSCILLKNLPEEKDPTPTELPNRFPNRPDRADREPFPGMSMSVQRLSQPEPRSRLPVRVDVHEATRGLGRAGSGV